MQNIDTIIGMPQTQIAAVTQQPANALTARLLPRATRMIVINAITESHTAAIHIKNHTAHTGAVLGLQQSSAPLNGQTTLSVRLTATTTSPEPIRSPTRLRLKARLRKPLLTQHAQLAAQLVPLLNRTCIPASQKQRIAMPPPTPIMKLAPALRVTGILTGIDGAKHGNYLRGRPDHFAA